jgi:hypothetical protein
MKTSSMYKILVRIQILQNVLALKIYSRHSATFNVAKLCRTNSQRRGMPSTGGRSAYTVELNKFET